jgi:hypothetical protein
MDVDLKSLLQKLYDDLNTIATSSTNAVAVQSDLDATEATVITDLTTLRTAIIAIATAVDAIAVKVNAAATNCATNLAATIGTPAITTA